MAAKGFTTDARASALIAIAGIAALLGLAIGISLICTALLSRIV